MFDWCTIEPTPEGITIVRLSRTPNVDEACSLFDHLVEQGLYHHRLYDMSEFAFDMDSKTIQETASYSASIMTDPNLAAFVAPKDLSYGILRIVAAMREQPEVSLPKVFRTFDQAWDWLASELRPA